MTLDFDELWRLAQFSIVYTQICNLIHIVLCIGKFAQLPVQRVVFLFSLHEIVILAELMFYLIGPIICAYTFYSIVFKTTNIRKEIIPWFWIWSVTYVCFIVVAMLYNGYMSIVPSVGYRLFECTLIVTHCIMINLPRNLTFHKGILGED